MISREYEHLFKDHYRSSVYIAEMIVNSRVVAEDIVQDVFLKLLDKDFQKIDHLANFLYTSVRNASIDHCRLRVIRTKEGVDLAQIPDNTDYDLTAHELEYADDLRKLLDAIESLPTQSRNVVKMICVERYSYKDAAQKLDMSVATVKTHMYRSFKRLRSRLSLFF